MYPRKRKVRVGFEHNRTQYRLSVTDPIVTERFMPEAGGIYPISEAILCLSLGELYKGCAYKLVAAMITPKHEI